MDVSDRQRICRLVAGILVADEEFTETEEAFLRRVCTRFGLPADEWDTLTPMDPGAASAELRQLPPDVQARAMGLLIEAALADGVVEPRERVFLLMAAAAFGIDAHAIEARLAARLETLDRHGPMSNP